MNYQDLVNLENAVLEITTNTVVKLNKNNKDKTKKNELGELKKVSKLTVKVGFDYAAEYKAATGNDFVPSDKPSAYEFVSKSIAKKGDAFYLKCIVLKSEQVGVYNEAGEMVEKEAYAEFLPAKQARAENALDYRVIKLSNIL